MASITVPQLPTLYEFYTSGGINSGLSAAQPHFTLNDRNVTLLSGAMHYFRVPPEYWRDRLRKMRAAGLNTVETYVPWNLHEPQPGEFDFGNGTLDGAYNSDLLDIERFLRVAQEEDLFAIVRPGPFICSEWEFGGFPSWLLRTKGIKVRTSQEAYMQPVRRFFNALLSILTMLQFTRGGPIIGFQVENEYGSTEADNFVPDRSYLEQLRELFLRNDITELLFTSDSPTGHGDVGTLPGVLFQTANFAGNPEAEFNALAKLQPGKPFMSMEFWTGWFDHWSEYHHTRNNTDFYDVLDRILKYPASVNMYMFHGGTSFGFMNGANIADGSTDNAGYQPDTTSYDYDAPLTEAGDYTEKYLMVKELIEKYHPAIVRHPMAPSVTKRKVYADLKVTGQLLLDELLHQNTPIFNRSNIMPMEFLPINNNSGQSYGYILYRKLSIDLPANSVLQIKGRVCDTVEVLVNGVLVSKPLQTSADLNGFGYWRIKDSTLVLNKDDAKNVTLDLLVENWGRNNFGKLEQFVQFKGLWQDGIFVNGKQVFDWQIAPFEFKSKWSHDLDSWHTPTDTMLPRPAIYQVPFEVVDEPTDTFLDMRDWTKGIVIVNGFVLGRYAIIGPQQTLYLPAPFFKRGVNEILVFEQFIGAESLRFTDEPIYHTI